jgi:pimeloyl-ACP methyl ester carboxylesterase
MKTSITLLFTVSLSLISFTKGYPQVSYKEIDLPVGNRISVKAESSSIVVPENRTTKRGRVELVFVRLSTTSNTPSFPIVWLSGGPGVPGIGSAREDMYAVLNALREVGDVILLDQRGTGQSKPSLRYEGERFSLPIDKAVNDEESKSKLIAYLQLWQQQLATKGIDIASYNTSESADDLEDLRLALNVEKMNLFAHSYGTHLALAYVKKYTNRVNRIVLGGVNGLDQRYRTPKQGDELLQRLDSMVQQEPGMKKLVSDLPVRLRHLIDKLNQNPVLVNQFSGSDRAEGPLHITGFDLQIALAIISGDTNVPMDLPAMLYKMEKGEF